MGDLRAGLVGYGQMGRHHARVLSELDGMELVGIADPDAGGRRPERFVDDVEALIRAASTWPSWPCPRRCTSRWGSGLAEAGVHALIEKPVAADAAAGCASRRRSRQPA